MKRRLIKVSAAVLPENQVEVIVRIPLNDRFIADGDDINDINDVLKLLVKNNNNNKIAIYQDDLIIMCLYDLIKYINVRPMAII